MDKLSTKELSEWLEENELGLHEIDVSVSENVKLEGPNRNQTISEWMKMYKDVKTSEERKNLREVAIRITNIFGCKKIVSDHGTFNSKFELSMPYNFFLTTVARLKETFKQSYSLSFHEIIDYTTGEIVDSLHINFMLDLLWLVNEYMLAAQHPKMTVIYGTLINPECNAQIPFDVTILEVEMPEFGCHHSKVSILKYKNGSIRIIVSTANFYPPDWEQWTQGLWVSPVLPPLPENASDSDGESVTYFKKDFIDYLNVYDQPEMSEWKSIIRRTDCSAIKVIFFASVPRYHESSSMNLWGHKRLYQILQEHATLPDNAKDWPIVAQCSSVGMFGQYYHSWMSTHIVHPMAKEKNKRIIHLPQLRFLYPTQKTFDDSFDAETGITPMLYYEEQHEKQKWIEENCLYQWTYETTGRARAMPHCKSYARISPDQTEIAWFVLTSANLSKAAWGKMIKGNTCQYIANYEAGVVFIPEIMINQTTFPIKQSEESEVPVFLLPYDMPLSAYEPGMKIALLPGTRPMGSTMEEKLKEPVEEAEAGQKEDDKLLNNEKVKKIFDTVKNDM